MVCGVHFALKSSEGDASLFPFATAAPFQELTYTDAIKLLGKSGKKFEFPVEWGLDLQKEHERYLVEVLSLAQTVLFSDSWP